MDFFWAKLDETCRNSSEYIFEHIESNFIGFRNYPVLHDSRVRLQGYGVLMDFFWSKPDETCRNSSEYIFEHIESNFSGLRNHPVLQDSRVRHQGHGESWWTFSGQNLMRLAEIVQNTFLNILKAILVVSGIRWDEWFWWISFWYNWIRRWINIFSFFLTKLHYQSIKIFRLNY